MRAILDVTVGPSGDDPTQPAVRVSIVIPTFRRERLLPDLLKACAEQAGSAPGALEIVVVDNTKEASALSSVEAAAAALRVPIRYVHEPRPGISHARNRGVREARGDLIAFIDDDELPAPDWLDQLLRSQRAWQADVVIGPTFPAFSDKLERMPKLFRSFFTYSSDAPTGTPISPHRALRLPSGRACHRPMDSGNALLVKAPCFQGEEPFSPELGLTGGEDTLFFAKLHQEGRRIIWCREAFVTERIPKERLTVRYLLRRKFRNGQITSSTCLLLDPPRYGQLATWIAVGLVQFCLGSAVAALAAALDRQLAVRGLCMAAAGLGKLVFLGRFRHHSYGAQAEG